VHLSLKNEEMAKASLRPAVELDPGLERARRLLARLENEMEEE